MINVFVTHTGSWSQIKNHLKCSLDMNNNVSISALRVLQVHNVQVQRELNGKVVGM